jgi:hypothetical protein
VPSPYVPIPCAFIVCTITVLAHHNIKMESLNALNIDNEGPSTSSQPRESLSNSIIPESSGRKRQKTAHVTTMPLLTDKLPLNTNATTLTTDQVLSTVDGTGEWDYLLHWARDDQDVMDVESMTMDEAMDEEEVDEPEESEIVDDEERELLNNAKGIEEMPSRSKLSHDQIVAIINEQIEHFTNTWDLNKSVHKDDRIRYDTQKMQRLVVKDNDS